MNPASGVSMLAEHDGTPEQYEERILTSLRTYDIEPEVWYTTPDDPGDGLARQAAKEGADLVIAAGGDGTIHAVAGGLIETRSTLGIIAMGTMNNLAHSLGIPDTIEAACAIIARGETKLIDIGKINDHVFLEVAGIGLEAELFPLAEEIKSSGWFSAIHDVILGLFKLFSYQPTRLNILFDGRKWRPYKALQVTICNSPYYGARFQLAPNALMDDGLLDVIIFKNFSKLEYLQHAASISQGRRVFQPKIVHRKAKSLYITADTSVEYHADGIPHGCTPATVTVVSGALRVRVPQKVASGPDMASPELKQTQHYKDSARVEIANEKGPEYAKQ
jgi:YegS/Rv2252/BmrU family lipid kinase